MHRNFLNLQSTKSMLWTEILKAKLRGRNMSHYKFFATTQSSAYKTPRNIQLQDM